MSEFLTLSLPLSCALRSCPLTNRISDRDRQGRSHWACIWLPVKNVDTALILVIKEWMVHSNSPDTSYPCSTPHKFLHNNQSQVLWPVRRICTICSLRLSPCNTYRQVGHSLVPWGDKPRTNKCPHTGWHVSPLQKRQDFNPSPRVWLKNRCCV